MGKPPEWKPRGGKYHQYWEDMQYAATLMVEKALSGAPSKPIFYHWVAAYCNSYIQIGKTNLRAEAIREEPTRKCQTKRRKEPSRKCPQEANQPKKPTEPKQGQPPKAIKGTQEPTNINAGNS